MKPKATLIAFVLCALLVPGPARAASPVERVETFHAALLDAMRNAFMEDVAERFDRLNPTVRDMFDFPTMMRIIGGSQWSGFSDAEKQVLTEAFTRLSVATYASNFSGYGGEVFETKGVRDGPKQSKLVDTEIVGKDGGRVAITYVLLSSGDMWRTVNVILDKGISELAVRRSEYAGILKNGGAAKLAEVLNAKADKLLAGP